MKDDFIFGEIYWIALNQNLDLGYLFGHDETFSEIQLCIQI